MLEWGFTTVFSTSHSNVDLREFAELRRAAHEDPALRDILVSVAPSPSPRVMRHNHVSPQGWRQAAGVRVLIDRYGARWQIVPAMLDALMTDADHGRTKRVAGGMLKMVKLDIAALTVAGR
jgi:predicted 3-demethylubiquinone-9 3-methyltransferase (glyoxalase superfamily)